MADCGRGQGNKGSGDSDPDGDGVWISEDGGSTRMAGQRLVEIPFHHAEPSTRSMNVVWGPGISKRFIAEEMKRTCGGLPPRNFGIAEKFPEARGN